MFARVINTNVEELGAFFANDEDNVATAIDAVGKLG